MKRVVFAAVLATAFAAPAVAVATITGDLTIKSITRPVTLTVGAFSNKEHPMLKKDAIGANATGVIRRSEFNAGYGVPAIGDEVRLDIALEAVTK